jgi:outer membrane lipoprotein-sorting protein
MKPAEKIEKFVKKMSFKAGPEMDKDLWAETSKAQNEFHKKILDPSQQNIRRTIMKSPIVKLAAAAVIIIAFLIVISQLGGSGASIVWAEVAQKVQASQGIIFRSKDIEQDWQDVEPDYTMNYFSSSQARHDSYKGDHIFKTIYADFNTKTVILVDHLPSRKAYVKMTFEEMEQVDFVTNPKSMVQRFLSCEHREIGQKIVEGVLCEGIETTDPTFDESGPDYPTDSVIARIWVSVKTGYPVQLETKIVRDNGKIQIGGVWDQFQWDIELDESMFEPEIPADYIDISP